jgi:BirA family biotin operon repressor/biotin-[acetyl-CoA-carboxylase] ligase
MRQKILQSLKDNNKQWLSGEYLSEILGVSRTAVWKQIKALQSEGYKIESSPKKGYRLSSLPDLLSPGEVCPDLTTRVLGRTHYLYYQELDSTNNQARSLAAQGYPEGTVVITEMQTAGRGRRGRSWFSPAVTGIYFSIILRPVMPLKEISRLSLVTAAAVAETLETELNLPARIKWPNDILINSRKIAGILSEAVTDMDGVEYIIIGVGLNTNNSIQSFPDDFRIPATSALIECTRPASRSKLLQSLLKNLENRYFQLLDGDFAGILDKVKRMSMVIGQNLKLDTINGFIIGQAIDINTDGFLVVRDQSGTIHTIMSGEISILPPAASTNHIC